MPLNANNRPEFEKVRKKCNIAFADECRRAEWPDSHKDVFEAIEKLKRLKHDTYPVNSNSDDPIHTEPWTIETKRRANKLPEIAKDLVSRNEATWRLACENFVFGRLASEVACKICRNRVWRSEVEASAEGNDRAASTLQLRQEKRDSCRCPVMARLSHEDPRASLDCIFIDRAEDWVVHPPELAKQLPQAQKPDRIYGLRQTKNIEELLSRRLPDGNLVEDLLPSQPHDATLGQPVLFPFLVVEAKAGNAPDDWHSIRLQTAFPIYTYLNTQQSLRSATSQRSRWTSGPLVWFFMSRGDDWRLSLAYQSGTATSDPPTLGRPGHTTKIVQVWAGCITNRDDALQLLLIVDYMSDWARDLYRTAVITELRTLAVADAETSTIFTDTDIFSSRHSVTAAAVVADDTVASHQDHNGVQTAFRRLDKEFGVVRHAAPIESRFRALIITEANVQMFLKLTNDMIGIGLILQILTQFISKSADAVTLTLSQLDSLEETWTGVGCAGRRLGPRETKLNSAYVVTYYLSTSWEQIRELCVVSINDRALDTLGAIFQLQPRENKASAQTCADSHSNAGFSLLEKIAKLKRAPIGENLLACVSRSCGRIQRYTDPYGGMNGRAQDCEPRLPDCGWRLQLCDSAVWETVGYAETVQKTSLLELEDPFFYTSTSLEVQSSDPRREMYPSLVLGRFKTLEISDQATVLVHGDAQGSPEQSPSSICMYSLRRSTEPPNQSELGCIIKQTFEDCDVYHTTRSHGTLDLRAPNSQPTVWNLDKVYGVFFSYGGESFVKWLQKLGHALPKRQGSLRGPYDSGRDMFGREYHPWHNPYRLRGEPEAHARDEFLQRLLHAEATAWAQIAQAHIRAGQARCPLCAWSASYTPRPLHTGANLAAMFYGGRHKRDDADVTMSATLRPHAPDLLQTAKSGADDSDAIEGLCSVCKRLMGNQSSWPAEWKRVVGQAVRKVISASVTDSMRASVIPESYCISTPRRLTPHISSGQPHDFGCPDREKSAPSDSDTDAGIADNCPCEATFLSPHDSTLMVGIGEQYRGQIPTSSDLKKSAALRALAHCAWPFEELRGRKRRRSSEQGE